MEKGAKNLACYIILALLFNINYKLFIASKQLHVKT